LLVAKKEALNYVYENDITQKTQIKNKPKPKKNFQFKVKFIVIALTVLAISLMLLVRYAQITKVRLELTAMNQNMAQLRDQKDDLLLQLEKIKDSGRIEQVAKERLGMTYPRDNQIVFVSVDESIFDQSDEMKNNRGINNSIPDNIKLLINFNSNSLKGSLSWMRPILSSPLWYSFLNNRN